MRVKQYIQFIQHLAVLQITTFLKSILKRYPRLCPVSRHIREFVFKISILLLPKKSQTYLSRPHIIFIYSNANAPEYVGRVMNYAESAKAIDSEVSVFSIAEAMQHLQQITQASLMIFYKTMWDEHIFSIIQIRVDICTACIYTIFSMQYATIGETCFYVA